ncbi:MAG: hypothetical protein FJZ90_07465 [Chloroflexi bacterium]|nr:hypothetical protein [Chloroflexota bacterium]
MGLFNTLCWGPFGAGRAKDQPIFYGYSPSVIPPASDWDGAVHVTGYWFLDPPAEWAPPPRRGRRAAARRAWGRLSRAGSRTPKAAARVRGGRNIHREPIV